MSDVEMIDETNDNNEWKVMAHEIAREFWRSEFLMKNPDASAEEFSEAWGLVAGEYRKVTRQALQRLKRKKGIVFSVEGEV